MPLEIEAKFKIPSLPPLRAKLQQLSASFIGEYLETNTFFDTPSRSLVASDQGLRLRQNHNLRTNETEFILTHKGPRLPGPFKSREETELTVADAVNAAALLQRLGFTPVLSFEKKRESWQLNDCRIELDEMPHLGAFIEIEGPTEPSILKTQELLDLANLPSIKPGYISLLRDHLKQHGITDHFIHF